MATGVRLISTRHADIPSIVAGCAELVAERDVDGLTRALVAVAGEAPPVREDRLRAARTAVEARHDANRIGAEVASLYREALAQVAP